MTAPADSSQINNNTPLVSKEPNDASIMRGFL